MANENFILKGDVCWSTSPCSIGTGKYLVCTDGKSAGVFDSLPNQYAGFRLIDYSGRLIIPGLVDLHTHAPQYAFRGLGMDLELLDWLKSRAFPEEAKYNDIEYARYAYGIFVEHLKKGPNTRLVIYATLHTPATLLLMDMLEESGLVCLVGKVNMDRNCPDYLCEQDAESSLNSTKEWLSAYSQGFNSQAHISSDQAAAEYKQTAVKYKQAAAEYKNVFPILTPRFIPACSDKLMAGLSQIQKKHRLPIQSHLSENRSEIEWVKELCPGKTYGGVYAAFDLFGNSAPAIMAHCTWSDEAEIALMAKRNVFIAHCPQSNMNLSSGIAPVRKFLEAGCSVGLGSDCAGGAHPGIFRAMSDAIQVSKLRRALINENEKPLTLEEAFYMGTAGGGDFFARARQYKPAVYCTLTESLSGAGCPVEAGSHATTETEIPLKNFPCASGSFEAGFDFDALVIDDSNLAATMPLSLRDRLERVVYLSDNQNIMAKYVRGVLISG